MKFLKAIVTRGPIGWFRRLFHVVRMYHRDLMLIANSVDAQGAEIQRALHFIKKATKLHVDVSMGPKDPTTIIAIGKYRGKDYVRAFPVQHKDLAHLIEQLKEMQKYAQIECIDAPMNIDATIKRELQI